MGFNIHVWYLCFHLVSPAFVFWALICDITARQWEFLKELRQCSWVMHVWTINLVVTPQRKRFPRAPRASDMHLPHQPLLSTTKRIGPLKATDETNVLHVLGQALDVVLDMYYHSDTHITSSPASKEQKLELAMSSSFTPARRRYVMLHRAKVAATAVPVPTGFAVTLNGKMRKDLNVSTICNLA